MPDNSQSAQLPGNTPRAASGHPYGTLEIVNRNVRIGLNLLADLEVQVARDQEAARAALHQIIDRNPTLGAAEQARQRIWFLERELNRHRRAPVIRS
jgi:hypothetical protein